jgi:hypothetical protein
VDSTPPTVSLTSPSSGGTVSGAISLTASASDNVAMDRVEFYVGSTLVGSSNASPYHVDWDTTTVPNGQYTLTAIAYDAPVGNHATSAPVTVTVSNADVTPPTVSLTSPSDGDIVSGSVGLAATASDNVGLSQVSFFVNGSLVSTDTTSPYTASWDSTTVADGDYAIKATAIDEAGNFTDSVTATVHVRNPDTTAPISTIACDGSACQTAAYSTSVSVSLTATDNTGGSGVAQIRYTTDDSTPTATTGTVYSSPFSVNATQTVKWLAVDNAGNAEAVRSQTITITPPDTTPRSPCT